MKYRAAILSGLLVLSITSDLPAQLFSPTQSVRSDENLQNATSLQNAGKLTRDRRFLRENRRRGDFVGRDVGDVQGFIGETQGRSAGRVETAVSTLREEPVIPINTPRPAPSRTGIYEPRLTVAFQVSSLPTSQSPQQVEDRIVRSMELKFDDPIVVSVTDGVATLSGEVDSEEARNLAELLVRFEPTVKAVDNRLQVRNSKPPRFPSDSR